MYVQNAYYVPTHSVPFKKVNSFGHPHSHEPSVLMHVRWFAQLQYGSESHSPTSKADEQVNNYNSYFIFVGT